MLHVIVLFNMVPCVVPGARSVRRNLCSDIPMRAIGVERSFPL